MLCLCFQTAQCSVPPKTVLKAKSPWILKNTFSCYLHQAEFLLQHTQNFSYPNKASDQRQIYVPQFCPNAASTMQEITNEQLKEPCYIQYVCIRPRSHQLRLPKVICYKRQRQHQTARRQTRRAATHALWVFQPHTVTIPVYRPSQQRRSFLPKSEVFQHTHNEQKPNQNILLRSSEIQAYVQNISSGLQK